MSQFDQPVRPEFREAVLKAVAPELKALRDQKRRSLLKLWLPAVTVTVAFALGLRLFKKTESTFAEFADLYQAVDQDDVELIEELDAEDLETLAMADFIEDLDEL